MRSGWKLKFPDATFLRASVFDKLTKQNVLNCWTKGTVVFSNLLEKRLNVYNGVKFVEVTVSKEMLGNALGGFILTKRMTSDIHSKTHKNKRGRRKKKK